MNEYINYLRSFYTHEVVEESTGKSWGIFPNENIAKIMKDELNRQFRSIEYGTFFIIKPMKDAMSGIDRNFQEDMINDMDMGE